MKSAGAKVGIIETPDDKQLYRSTGRGDSTVAVKVFPSIGTGRGGSRIFRRGGLTTARGNGVCSLPRKAEKLFPLLFVTKN